MEPKKETQRIEAFSDGVYAIAITLLVLELKPAIERTLNGDHHASLFAAMQSTWPVLVAYVVSFATIGIMWINHHRLFNIITRSDHLLVILNLLLLFAVTTVPFPTALLGEHTEPEQFRQATVIYSGTFFLCAIAYNALWRYSTHRGRLTDKRVDIEIVNRISRQYWAGPALYLLALILAFFSPILSLGLSALLAAFFLLPGIDPIKRTKKQQDTADVPREAVE